jgi:hypothetical protein
MSITSLVSSGSPAKWRDYLAGLSCSENVGRLAFANRLNDIVPLLGETWLDQSELTVKKTVKKIILEKIPAKRD